MRHVDLGSVKRAPVSRVSRLRVASRGYQLRAHTGGSPQIGALRPGRAVRLVACDLSAWPTVACSWKLASARQASRPPAAPRPVGV